MVLGQTSVAGSEGPTAALADRPMRPWARDSMGLQTHSFPALVLVLQACEDLAWMPWVTIILAMACLVGPVLHPPRSSGLVLGPGKLIPWIIEALVLRLGMVWLPTLPTALLATVFGQAAPEMPAMCGQDSTSSQRHYSNKRLSPRKFHRAVRTSATIHHLAIRWRGTSPRRHPLTSLELLCRFRCHHRCFLPSLWHWVHL
mmetsp:Transcript_20425/g.39904  ORF Transcript_20425/g.39904 Transcript_20425/m.39904 type:complete len:201 (-) Transcript_20425:530-1132(-)